MWTCRRLHTPVILIWRNCFHSRSRAQARRNTMRRCSSSSIRHTSFGSSRCCTSLIKLSGTFRQATFSARFTRSSESHDHEGAGRAGRHLETMTPSSFSSFRDRLDTAFGFQSVQFREMEFSLGYKRPSTVNYLKPDYPEVRSAEPVAS